MAGKKSDSMVSIRPAKVKDASIFAEVFVRAWQKGDRGIRPDWFLDALSVTGYFRSWKQRLSEMPANEVSFVAELNGALVGFLHGKPADPHGLERVVELGLLNVHPDYWSHGVGSALLKAFVDWAIQRGAGKMILWVASANSRARGFYERHGWTADGTVRMVGAELYGVPVEESRYRRELSRTRGPQ
jgi:GNAT superfamily N-acetyltransferase